MPSPPTRARTSGAPLHSLSIERLRAITSLTSGTPKPHGCLQRGSGGGPRISLIAPMRSLMVPERSAFPPIADYALLSDCEAAALVAPSGNVEWMCVPVRLAQRVLVDA